jgi:hypothetical protein
MLSYLFNSFSESVSEGLDTIESVLTADFCHSGVAHEIKTCPCAQAVHHAGSRDRALDILNLLLLEIEPQSSIQ